MNKAEAGLFIALSKFQAEMDFAKKDKKGYGYSYTDYASLVEIVRKGFAGKNLSFIHLINPNDTGQMTLTTRIIYACEETHEIAYIESSIPMQSAQGKSMNALQGAGAGITYLKRYTLQALVGLPSEDDDGKGGEVQVANKKQKQAPPSQQPQAKKFTVALMKTKQDEMQKRFEDDANLTPAALAQRMQKGFEGVGYVFDAEISSELKSFCAEIFNIVQANKA